MRAFAFALIVLAHAAAWADTLHGKVVGITDGDTLTVLSAENKSKVRLGGLMRLSAGNRSTKQRDKTCLRSLSEEMVTVDWHNRLVGTVAADRLDFGWAQVRAGQAWWFRRPPKAAWPTPVRRREVSFPSEMRARSSTRSRGARYLFVRGARHRRLVAYRGWLRPP